jgi:ribosomal protein S12 methylthiotransferase accessory factor YcaO
MKPASHHADSILDAWSECLEGDAIAAWWGSMISSASWVLPSCGVARGLQDWPYSAVDGLRIYFPTQ